MLGALRDLAGMPRRLRRSPGLTLAAVATLALGVGAAGAVFAVVDAVLLRPLPYGDASRLVAVFANERLQNASRNPTSPADFLEWRRSSRTLERLTAARPWSPVLTGRGHPEEIPGLAASPELFDLLGVPPALGAVFHGAADDHQVVLSDSVWRRRFGGDPGIVGQSLVLDGQAYTVAGVMPAGFRFPPFWATEAELWAPLVLGAEQAANHDRFLRVFARLRAGTTLERARAEMDVVAARLAAEWPKQNASVGVSVEPLVEPVVSRARPALLVLAGAVGLVLLIACANVTGLLTAEGLAREKEAAVRYALGASRARLLGHWLAEDLVLSLAGGLGGLALARLGVSALVALGPEGLPRLQEIAVGPRSTIFTLVLAVLAGAASGLVPALRSSRPDVAASLKHGARVAGAGRHRLHDGLVVGELAMAVVLLVGAGLLARSFVLLQRPDPGFRADGLLTLNVSLSGSPRVEGQGRSAFLTDVAEGVLGVPGVVSAAFSNHLPVGGDTWRTRFQVEGRPVPEEELPRAVMRTVTPHYPRAMGLPIRAGRSFDDRDRAEGRLVVLVNEALVRQCWPGASPMGARLRLAGPREPWRTVVGVVGDALQTGVGEPVQPEILFPYTQDPVAFYNGATLVVRTRREPRAVAEAVKARVWAVAPELPITRVLTMREVLRESVTRERLDALLMGLVSGLALLLATVGIYGVTAYAVGRRAHEIAVRMALGARARQVAAMVVAEGLRLGLRGLALGALGALLLSRALRGLLHDVSPADPATYLAVGLLLVAVVVAACLVPALRAARVDPLAALRDE